MFSFLVPEFLRGRETGYRWGESIM